MRLTRLRAAMLAVAMSVGAGVVVLPSSPAAAQVTSSSVHCNPRVETRGHAVATAYARQGTWVMMQWYYYDPALGWQYVLSDWQLAPVGLQDHRLQFEFFGNGYWIAAQTWAYVSPQVAGTNPSGYFTSGLVPAVSDAGRWSHPSDYRLCFMHWGRLEDSGYGSLAAASHEGPVLPPGEPPPDGPGSAPTPPADGPPVGGGGPPAPAPVGGQRFSDVGQLDLHADAIERVADLGWAGGFPDGTYRPAEPVQRGQMATFLMRATNLAATDGASPFNDTAGSVHEQAITTVADAGYASGFNDGSFRPTTVVTRGQMASFLMRAFDLPAASTPAPFADIAGSVHADAISAVEEAGIASGFADGTFGPDAPVTRAQMATFLVRAAT